MVAARRPQAQQQWAKPIPEPEAWGRLTRIGMVCHSGQYEGSGPLAKLNRRPNSAHEAVKPERNTA
jgi:hypothetical protein